MKISSGLSAITGKLDHGRNLLHQLVSLVNDKSQTYYPELKQKSKFKILAEQLLWIFRNKELNRYYYVYGLDAKDEHKSREILGYRKFRSLRDRSNLRPRGLNFNYACLLRDKFVFGQYFSSLNIATPKNIALLDKKGLTWLDTMKNEPMESLTNPSIVKIDGFCKKLMGIKGEGAFPLRIEDGKIFLNDKQLTTQELAQKIDGTYLLQQRMGQHSELARIHPQSLNTMRLLTFNNGGNIELFSATLRVGTDGRNVDNWGAGGIAIGIDIETGTLREMGKYKPGFGGRVGIHPDTKIVFAGYKIPCFKESIEMVCNAHRYLYGIHSIGWDVAVDENGPVLIEANEDWDGSFAMSMEENFKSRFLKMYNKKA